jgi:hypothetical protein
MRKLVKKERKKNLMNRKKNRENLFWEEGGNKRERERRERFERLTVEKNRWRRSMLMKSVAVDASRSAKMLRKISGQKVGVARLLGPCKMGEEGSLGEDLPPIRPIDEDEDEDDLHRLLFKASNRNLSISDRLSISLNLLAENK